MPDRALHPDLRPHAAMHGSPHSHDARVPMILRSTGLALGGVDRPAGIEAPMPSVAAGLGLRPPEQADGIALPELIPPAAD